MIIQEPMIRDDGVQLVHTYSDKHVFIRQDDTGIEYAEAVDLPNKHTYTETDVPIPDYEQETIPEEEVTMNESVS